MLLKRLLTHQSVSINQISQSRCERESFYHYLKHEQVDPSLLIRDLITRSCAQLSGTHKLVICDDTEINLTSHQGRIKDFRGLGLVGNDRDIGFFLHSSIVLDPQRAFIEGISDVQIWHREAGRKRKLDRHYQSLPIEEKESYRWLLAAQHSREVLPKVDHITIIADRESDQYEEWARIRSADTDLLIRACRDRRISEGDGKLYAYLAAQPLGDTCSFYLRGDPRIGRQSRHTTLEIRFVPVSIRSPDKFQVKAYPTAYPETVQLWALEAKEVATKVPQGEKPVHWRILTTHRITDAQSARQILTWYTCRWWIEQLFRLLKKQGFSLEDAQLESGMGLIRLSILTLEAALKVLQLTTARENQIQRENQTEDIPINIPIGAVFNEQEQGHLKILNPQYEGRTQKQKNPYSPQQLLWATWIIARLGGWKGMQYKGQRPPGPITLFRGLKKFNTMAEAFDLIHKLNNNKNILETEKDNGEP